MKTLFKNTISVFMVNSAFLITFFSKKCYGKKYFYAGKPTILAPIPKPAPDLAQSAIKF